jgi:serine/threonine protein kinase
MKICPQCKTSFGEQDFRACPFDGAELRDESHSAADPMIGRILDGRFRIVDIIGQGGMGAVYKAVHTQMDRVCAIKLLAPVTTDREGAIARFRREAKLTSRIDSPNAVTIYDFGEAEPGLLYLAMEYIEGESLAQALEREHCLPIERVVGITNQIANALGAAHLLGIVHRDLKPANIMLSRKRGEHEVVKVLDFGIAKAVADNNNDNLTQTGFVLGTPTYMSPEQVLGEDLDVRSDVYSLSIMVYQMLSGLLPFEGDNLRTLMMKRVNSDPRALRTSAPLISEAIERVVMSGLARNPEERIADVQQFAAALMSASTNGAPFIGNLTTVIDGGGGNSEVSARLAHGTSSSQSAADPGTLSANEQLTSHETYMSPIVPAATIVSPSGIELQAQDSATMPASRPTYSHDTIVSRWQQPDPAARPQVGGTSQPGLATVLIVLAVVAVIAALGAGGLYFYRGSKQARPIASNQPTSQAARPYTGGDVSADERTNDEHYKTGKSMQQQASVLTDQGSTTAAAARNEEAINEYRKALEGRPIFPEAHENIGVALYSLGRPADAAAEYQIAIKQYEKPSAQVLTNYGMALLETKNFHEAAGAFSRALVIKPTDADLYYYRGFALHYAGDDRGSREAFGKYLEVAPQGEHAKDVRNIIEGRAAPSLK